MSGSNPYASPGAVPPTPTPKAYSAGTRRLQYGAMFGFAFANPNWVMNLLWGGLCMLCSGLAVPQICFSGYLWETIERLHRKEAALPPDFDINRFGDYLTRGIWPYLVSLIMFIPMIMLFSMMFSLSGVFAGIIASQGGEVAGIVAMITFWGLAMLSLLPIHFVFLPFMLRAGLSQDLGTAFNVAWVMEFIRLVWKEMLLGFLALGAAFIPVYFLGLAMLCIGVYPAIAAWFYASTHFNWQLYEIFLERGGTPIPLKASKLPIAYAAPQQY